MIVLKVLRVEEIPVRSTDLPKRETCTGKQHVGKRANWETVYQSVGSKTWVIWIKLNCLKSSGKLETGTPMTKRLMSCPDDRYPRDPDSKFLSSGTMVNETYQATNGRPKSS